MRALVLALAGLGLAVVPVPPAAASAAAQTCQGQTPTIVSTERAVEGTDGNDVILAIAPNTIVVTGGAGDDLICVEGQLSGDGFEFSSIGGGPGIDSLFVRTGSDRDFLEMWNDTEVLDIGLGGGFDKLRMHGAPPGPGGRGHIDGGADGGVLQVDDLTNRIRVDLEDGILHLKGTVYQLTRFGNVRAAARKVVLDGDRRANGLSATGCRIIIEGGRGDDVLVARTASDLCHTRSARLLGQKGDDRLEGTPEDDVLLGGSGRDRANGRDGNDKCAAEREKACERSPGRTRRGWPPRFSVTVVPVPATATVAAATCQGQTATIVGTGGRVEGTHANDVILATGTGLHAVYGGGGDDLICVEGQLPGHGGDFSVIGGGPGRDSLVVRTGPDQDFLEMWNDTEVLDIGLGGGFDRLRMHGTPAGPGGSGHIDAGADGGILHADDHTKGIRVDLGDGIMHLKRGVYRVSRFDQVKAVARNVVLDGDRRANYLSATGCRIIVEGGRGDDVIRARTLRMPNCEPRGARIIGQQGADRLEGTSEADVLLGGSGRDRANGHEGSDRCVAEEEKGCER